MPTNSSPLSPHEVKLKHYTECRDMFCVGSVSWNLLNEKMEGAAEADSEFAPPEASQEPVKEKGTNWEGWAMVLIVCLSLNSCTVASSVNGLSTELLSIERAIRQQETCPAPN